MYPLKQSTSLPLVVYAFDSSGDSVTGKVDGDWTKSISKNGAALAAMTVTVTELSLGFYALTLSSAHSDTLGILTISLIASGVKRVNLQFRVHARIEDDLAFPTVSGRNMDVDADGGVEIGAIETTAHASIRTAVGLATANLDTQLDALPTNSELATALAAADDAVLAAVAALNNLSLAQLNAAIAAGDDATLAAIAALNNISLAGVKTQITDALAVDTYGEPGQGSPAATTTLAVKINMLYKSFRNLKKQTSTLLEIYNDAGSVVDHKATTGESAGTTTLGEIVSGP